MSDRRELRSIMRRMRDSIDADLRCDSSEKICHYAEQLIKGRETAFVYASVGSEVETKTLIRTLWAKGCRVCLPAIRGKGMMNAVEYLPGAEMHRDRYGIPTPAEAEIVPPEKIDVIFLPGLAFDWQGGRLGYGGGYYDRFCALCGAARIALAFDAQITDKLPTEPWDATMDAIVSETGVKWIRQNKIR